MKRIKSFSDYLEGLKSNEKINSGKPFIIQNQDATKLASDLVNFTSKNGVRFSKKNMPSVTFSNKKQEVDSPIFKETGNYSPMLNSITIFTKGRDLKDCLRSLSHELIHADQHINKEMDTGKATGGILNKGRDAEKIEADAYERGNLLFRKWEETLKKSTGKI